MEKVGELESSGEQGCMDVGTRGFTGFPAAVGLNLVEGPAAEGEIGRATVFDGVPVVGGDVCGSAF